MDSITAVENASPRPHPAVRWARSLIDGKHPWGDLNIGLVDRTGSAVRYQLVVYPPGITSTQRRALVLRRHWPVSGMLFSLLLSALLGNLMNC